MDQDLINYGKLIDDAMHIIVKEALKTVVTKGGLPGAHHFFISFLTRYPGVTLSERLRQKYPNEMTIVLQYQFEELEVNDDAFNVVLSFDNVKERVVIPFEALTAFADPSVKFGLQFRFTEEDDTADSPLPQAPASKDADTPVARSTEPTKSSSSPTAAGNVITLDNFRKK